MPKPNRCLGSLILRQLPLHWLLTRIGIGNESSLPRCAAPGEDRENTPDAQMPTSYPGWRETLIVALQCTLHSEYSAGQVPHALLEVPGHRLPALEDAILRQYWHADFPGFAWPLGAQPDAAATDARLFCAGCHRDGRIRERALRLMRGRPGPLATALTLIRCDDWVPQVRVCAEEALQQIVATDPAALFAHLGLLFVLRERQRIRSGVWRTLIEPALLSPAHSAARWQALDHGGSRQRLFVCDLILRAEPGQIDALALHTVRNRDPVIACWALRELPRVSGMPLNDALIAHALRHPNASVRAYGLRLRARTPDDAFRALLRESLFDPSASVRNVAAYALRNLGSDPREIWRDAIDRGIEPGRRYALLALGDCAEAEDLARIAPWFRHSTGELRCAVLRAAMRAGIDNPAALLSDALASPSSKVVGLALKLGATVPAFITRATLANALAVAANPLTRQRLINATHQLSRWDALDCLLDGVDQDPHASDALRALIAWGNEAGRRFAPLSADRKRSLLQRIDTMTPRNMHIAWLPVRRVVEAG
jgi:hypothetical protein